MLMKNTLKLLGTMCQELDEVLATKPDFLAVGQTALDLQEQSEYVPCEDEMIDLKIKEKTYAK